MSHHGVSLAVQIGDVNLEVVVADPNFASMYATRSRKVKTDKRDARTLCEACRLGVYRPAHRTSDRQQRGHISKAGPGRARHLLVEAAWTILRRRSSANAALHERGARIAARRGARVAVVALARKLAGILYAMWRDGTKFEARSLRTEAGFTAASASAR